jgi:hypothetical protein
LSFWKEFRLTHRKEESVIAMIKIKKRINLFLYGILRQLGSMVIMSICLPISETAAFIGALDMSLLACCHTL